MRKKDIQFIIEITQYTLIGFWLSAIGGVILNYLEANLDENTPTFVLLIDISFNIVLISLLIYFVKIILNKIPLLIKIVDNYKVEMDKTLISIGISVSLIYTITQSKLKNKIRILKERLFN